MNSRVKNGLFMCFAFIIYCAVPQKLTLEKTYKPVCKLPVNLRLKSIYQHKYWIFFGNIGEPVVVNTH